MYKEERLRDLIEKEASKYASLAENKEDYFPIRRDFIQGALLVMKKGKYFLQEIELFKADEIEKRFLK